MSLNEIPVQAQHFARLVSLIEESQEICLCAHTSPDGDALGSTLGFAHILRRRWPNKHVVTLLAEDDPIPRIYRYLPGVEAYIPASKYHDVPDVMFSLDVSVAKRLNEAEEVWMRAKKRAIIDHHPCADVQADAWLIRPTAAATGVLIAEFALFLGMDINVDTARCLYCALATDTGRFQYQNADPEAFQVASLLVDAGASPSELSLNVYQNFSLSYLHLQAIVMARITTFSKGKISYSYATRADFERTGASLDECDGLVDLVRSVAGSEVSLFLKEAEPHKVRGNLRSKTDVDVSPVARAFGGGGHRAASGFTFDGDIDEALSAALPLLKALFEEDASTARESANNVDINLEEAFTEAAAPDNKPSR